LTVVYGISNFLSQNLLYARGTATRPRHSGCIESPESSDGAHA
jgi:hypothetical protein